MPVHLEQIAADTWILRAGPRMQRFGDPYQVSAVVRRRESGVAEVVAMPGLLYPGFLREARVVARLQEFRAVVWERVRGGDVKAVTMEISDGDS